MRTGSNLADIHRFQSNTILKKKLAIYLYLCSSVLPVESWQLISFGWVASNPRNSVILSGLLNKRFFIDFP